LSNYIWPKQALITIGIWGVGGLMVIVLSGVQDVAAEHYEAAASARQIVERRSY
jgi:ABC-type sugar transport system permease subunit